MDRTTLTDGFGPWDGITWLNCAHQGALPEVAAEAAREALAWKIRPSELTQERFNEVPRHLRHVLGRLIGAPPEDVILANSASYGLHLVANGYPWREGDEVLLVRGDFPSVVLPWLGLESRGVRIRWIDAAADSVRPEQVLAHIGARTRLFCTTWVHSFRGHAIDADGIGDVCRSRGVTFMLNTSQGLGARPFDVMRTPVDAITNVGFKWLCGPYGTGFCWVRPELLGELRYNKSYWLSMQTAEDLEQEGDVVVREDLGARRYDVFGTANFFNFVPFTSSLELLLSRGVRNIERYDQDLVGRFIDGLDASKYALVSPREGVERSTLVVFTPRDPLDGAAVYRSLREQGVFVALRRGNLRVSPHLFNTAGDIDRALELLNAA